MLKMIDSVTFGSKEDFAIELGIVKISGKYKLCFWINNKRIGSFKKSDVLNYFIKACSTFITDKDNYYLPVFDKMTPTEIVRYALYDLIILGRSTKREDIQEYEKRKALNHFWGLQFSTDGGNILVLYKNEVVLFYYNAPKKITSVGYVISFSTFQLVFNEFMDYVATLNLPVKA